MSQPQWVRYEDGLKLILTGSTTTTLSPEQRGLFLDMLTCGTRDETGCPTQERQLKGVKTQHSLVDEAQQQYETFYNFTDLFRYMASAFEEWDVSGPPIAIPYLKKELNQEKDLVLILKKYEIQSKLNELEQTTNSGDPLKMEAQERLQEKLEKKLMDISHELQHEETPEERKQRFIEVLDEERTLRGERGALQRAANREGISRQRFSQIIKS